jgi:hypothetical protein
MHYILGIAFVVVVAYLLVQKKKPVVAEKITEEVKTVETAVVEQAKVVETAVVEQAKAVETQVAEEVKAVVAKVRKPRAKKSAE